MTDYISREAAIKSLCNLVPHTCNRTDCGFACQSANAILSIPAADVRPVVLGKWIPVTNGRGGFECSLCHEYAPSFRDGVENLSNFCPNCGADMRKQEEET